VLVKPLEDFLTYFRPLLICGDDPGTLFINEAGTSMTRQQLEEAVEEMTLRYAGKLVHPHLFRDITALAWLKDNKGDYLTLSKILWHKNVLITVDIYSSRYNESVGANAMNKWVEERGRTKRVPANRLPNTNPATSLRVKSPHAFATLPAHTMPGSADPRVNQQRRRGAPNQKGV
jgi:hypothetical protein